MENMVPSPIERPAPSRVRFPTQEEILTAPDSKDSSPEGYSEGYSEDLSETSDY
ncbi:nuclease [Mucor velutinosus]|uniref:Nuclease n=1 Tax=Mucor velutinosus TaxID=708070 RepID=A0AAN7DLM1_9FUNG|nr:nuclease [Mucor velutinosus]